VMRHGASSFLWEKWHANHELRTGGFVDLSLTEGRTLASLSPAPGIADAFEPTGYRSRPSKKRVVTSVL
jgi:hypothetical protein